MGFSRNLRDVGRLNFVKERRIDCMDVFSAFTLLAFRPWQFLPLTNYRRGSCGALRLVGGNSRDLVPAQEKI